MPEHSKLVIELLGKSPQGLTNTELKHRLKLSPYIIAIELAKLEGAGRLDVRMVGKARLNYLKK